MEMNQQAEKKLHGLDFLRALAIIQVMFFHYKGLGPHPEWMQPVFEFGWAGVPLFFALSGFLISSQLFAMINRGAEISFKEFFLKRFFRIIPAYLLVVAIYFLVPSFHEREALSPLWKFLTFTQNIGLDFRTMGTFSHAWSLCVEEQFYLFFPLILIALVYYNRIKQGFIVLLILFLAGFALRFMAWNQLVLPYSNNGELFYPYWHKFIYYPTYARLDGLIFGIVVAGIFHFRPRLKARLIKYGNAWLALGVAVLIGGYYLSVDQHTLHGSLFSFPVVDFGCGLLVLGAVCNSSILFRFKSSFITFIASLSYSMYLVHKMVFHVTQDKLSSFNLPKESNLMLVCCALTTIGVAFLLHQVVEKPFMRMRDGILQKPSLTVKPAVVTIQ